MFWLVVVIVLMLLLDRTSIVVRVCNRAVSMSGKGVLDPHGALGKGGLGDVVLWDLGPDAV